MSANIQTANWHIKHCDVCSSSEAEIVGTRTYDVPVRGRRYRMEFEDAVCRKCGFVYERRIPDEDFLFRYYHDSFSREGLPTDAALHYDLKQRLTTLTNVLPQGAAIVEIGANTGEFAQALKDEGYRVTALDPVASNSQVVNSGFISSSGAVSEHSEGDKFDGIVSYFVLEHVTQAVDWMTGLLDQFAKPGSKVVMEVPDFYQYPHESLNHEHLLHFSETHLKWLYQRLGIEPLSISSQEKSRYFGISASGVYTGKTSAGVDLREGQQLFTKSVTCYEAAIKQKRELEQGYRELAERIAGLGNRIDGVVVWAANEIASGIGLALQEVGISARIVDNSSQKHGQYHSGFDHPICEPKTYFSDEYQYAHVLCSPAWNSELRKQVEAAGVSPSLVFLGAESES